MLPILVISCLFARPPLPSKVLGDDTKQPSGSAWDWSIVKRPVALLTGAGFFLIDFGLFMPLFFTTEHAIAHGFSSNLSFYTISILNGASLFGRILPGILTVEYGRFNLCIISTIFSAVIGLCWTKVTSVAGLVSFSLAYGFTSGVSLGPR